MSSLIIAITPVSLIEYLPHFLPLITDYSLIIAAFLSAQCGAVVWHHQVLIITGFRYRRGVFLRSYNHRHFTLGTLTPRVCHFQREGIVAHNHVGYMKYRACATLLK